MTDSLTVMRPLGDLLDACELPCGVLFNGDHRRSVKLRPWSWEDEGWLGERQEARGQTPGGFLRDAIGWLTEELVGQPMTRGAGEIASPNGQSPERAARRAVVGSLCWGDLLTVLLMIKAAEDPILALPGQVPGQEPEIIQFDARTTLVRCLAPGRTPDELVFDHAGATWGPPTSAMLDVVTQGTVSAIKGRRRLLQGCHRGGRPLTEMGRAELAGLPARIDEHTPGPVLHVPGKTDDGKEAVAVIPLSVLFRF